MLLVELLANTTEKLCGYKPNNEMVEQFLMRVSQETIIQLRKEPPTHVRFPVKMSSSLSENYTGKSIVAFTFKGRRYDVRSWREMLIRITELMLSAHREQFNKVLNLVGRKRPYFTRNPNELRIPERVDNTNIYVETHLNANSIVKLSKNIIALFGYKEDDLSIEVR